MKKHTFIPEILIFSIILIACIIPPFFVSSESIGEDAVISWTFPWQAICHALFALALYIISYKLLDEYKNNFKGLAYFIFYFLIPASISFCALFSVSLLMKFFSVILKIDSSLNIEKPNSFIEILFCLLLFSNSAFYEEVIYRFYFPQALLRFIRLKNQKKWLEITAEIFGALLFAFAHLYSGYISVINAFIAHFILRICFKKSGNIWAGFTAHTLYNIISLILL
ncbi:MAG: CPBP family intramembrane metalloprotease [Treponema sp.]|nr:CPBP family intramembrane metalloprotease [Treponema sp.]